MNLHTGGTIRAQFDDDYRNASRARRLLGEAIAELQVPGHYMGLVDRALELVDDDVSDADRWSLRLVVTALLSAVSSGSSGLAVDGTADDTTSLAGQLDEILTTAGRLADSDETIFDETNADERAADFNRLSETDGVWGRLVGGPDDNTPLVVDRGGLYLHKLAALERRVADDLAGLIDGRIIEPDAADDAIETVLDTMPFVLDAAEKTDKRRKLSTAVRGRFGVITGGAGTGKTTLVFSVLRVLDAVAPEDGGSDISDVALAAPTGKAAYRLGESIEDQLSDIAERHGDETQAQLERFYDELDEPKTLHRLLEYSPYFDEFRRDADNPIDAKLVVVDEASMVGVEMMEALASAIADDARLLLVGDAGQLPSVEGGAVFHDLTDTEKLDDRLGERVCKLVESHRVDKGDANNILDVAEAIRELNVDLDELESTDTCRFARAWDDDEAGVYFFDSDRRDEQLGAFLDRWVETYLEELIPLGSETDEDNNSPLYRSRTHFDHTDEGGFVDEVESDLNALFDRASGSQLLTLTRVGDRGSNRLNRRLHRRYREAHRAGDEKGKFLPGEPVMVTRNDYDAGVFNGDQGIILYTRRPWERGESRRRAKKRLVVRQNDGYRAIALDRVRDKLKHAYAVTVHKSQGSEYGHIGLILPKMVTAPGADEDGPKRLHPMVTSQLLYTALTRAEKSVTIFGQRRVFEEGAKRWQRRFSGLGRRISDRLRG